MTAPLPPHLLKPRMWTAERDALLRALISGGTPPSKCVAPVAALDGAPITKKRQITARMTDLGIRLSDEHLRAALRAASTGRSNGKGAHKRMTPERLDYLRAAYDRGEDDAAIWAALAGMPGPAISSPKAIQAHAKKHGLKRTRPVSIQDPQAARERKLARRRELKAAGRDGGAKAPVMAKRAKPRAKPVAAPESIEIAPVVEPSPEIADAVTEARYARVRAALAKRNADAAALARVHGMPLREVYRLVGEVRREMRA